MSTNSKKEPELSKRDHYVKDLQASQSKVYVRSGIWTHTSCGDSNLNAALSLASSVQDLVSSWLKANHNNPDGLMQRKNNKNSNLKIVPSQGESKTNFSMFFFFNSVSFS